MSWLRECRAEVVAILDAGLAVPVLAYEPRGDMSGGVFVTVRVVGVDVDNADLEIRIVAELRADRAAQDVVDDVIDDVDAVLAPVPVYLRGWSVEFDDTTGAIVATGAYYGRRWAGWCDPTSEPSTRSVSHGS